MNPPISEIIPGLYLGGLWSTEPETLKLHSIQAVLNVANKDADINRGKYPLKEHLVLEIQDNPHQAEKMLNDVFPKAFEFIDNHYNSCNVLIHCMGGVSRSATVVVAWLMKRFNLSSQKAIDIVNEKRKIQPNEGFLKLLL